MTLNTHSRQKHWVGRCHFQPFFREAPSVTTYASSVTHPVIEGREGNILPEKHDHLLPSTLRHFHHRQPTEKGGNVTITVLRFSVSP